MKKLIKAISSILLIVLLFTGCAGGSDNTGTSGNKTPLKTNKETTGETADPKDLPPYEIVWYSLGKKAEDHQEVVDEISKRMKEKFNATLKLIPLEQSEHSEKLSMMIDSQQKFDLTFVSTQYADYVAKQAFEPLTDLLKKYGKTMLDVYPQNLWDSVTVNGEIYAIPTHKYSCQHVLYNLNRTEAEKVGVDVDKVKDWESFKNFMIDMKKAGGDPNGYVGNMAFYVYSALYPMEAMTGNDRDPGVVIIGDQSYSNQKRNIVFNQFDTPEFKAFCEDAYMLAQKGCLPRDPDTKVELDKFDPAVSVQDSMAKRTPGYEKTYGVKLKPYFVNNATQTTSKIYGSMNAISATSGDPARAMMLVDLLNSDVEFADLFFYGIEGKHWGRNEEGQIDLSMYLKEGETRRYDITAWALPGFLTAEPDTSLPLDMVDRYNKFADTLLAADNLGFALDETPIMTELAAVRSVVQEYLDPLAKGLSNPDKELPKFLKALESSGVDRIIGEQQKQLDSWRKKQGK